MPQTGATRHQKFLKSEKSKTKLKTKKKDLPKGTNVTKTNFKIKKIVIKEQLKKHGTNEALSTKKLNIKELLSRLNHFNTKSRTEALDGLRELVTNYSNVLELHLGQLLLGVSPLVLNVEKVVRLEALKVLHLILSNTQQARVDPFYDIMSTYLRSAMTHIDARIQEDSLLFLDLLLTCTSQKVIQDIHKILPNFLDMISKLRVDSKPGRTLTVNLGSQITSVKWRVKVLHRLKDFLEKYLQHNQIQQSKMKAEVNNLSFHETKAHNYSLYNPEYLAGCHLNCFSSQNCQDLVNPDIEEKFKEYVTTLMPLLFETWLEVSPKSATDINIETVVNEDTAFLLRQTLEVISLLYNLIEYHCNKHGSSVMVNFFSQNYGQQFIQHFVHSFPYVTNVRKKQKNANESFEETLTDPKLTSENLKICDLFLKFNPNINLKNQSGDLKLVVGYIEKTLSVSTPEYVSGLIIKILHTIFSSQNSWTKTSIIDPLLYKIIRVYLDSEICIALKHQIFSLLCKITLNDSLKNLQSNSAFKEWFKTLPNILLDDMVTDQTINILHMFAVQNNESFNNIFKPKLLEIIKKLPDISISESTKASYHKLFSLLYWIKNWDSESINLLEQQLLNNVYKSDDGKYIFDTLRLRVGGIL